MPREAGRTWGSAVAEMSSTDGTCPTESDAQEWVPEFPVTGLEARLQVAHRYPSEELTVRSFDRPLVKKTQFASETTGRQNSAHSPEEAIFFTVSNEEHLVACPVDGYDA